MAQTVPAVVLAYGPSKRGKTSDTLFSFPRGLFIAGDAAIKPSIGLVGYRPQNVNASTIPEATQLVAAVAKQHAGAFDAVVVDDFSLLADTTLKLYEQKFRTNHFRKWGQLREDVLDFRDTARACGMHVVIICHQREPETREGRFYRGGPMLPSRNLTDMIPVICDTVLRTGVEPGRRPWSGVYHCDPTDPQYVTGDRHAVCPPTCPMNLRELLVMAGYQVARAPGLEWQDEWAEGIAQVLLTNGNRQAVLTKAAEALRGQGKHDQHIAWALRDGLDRFAFRKAKQAAALSGFGLAL